MNTTTRRKIDIGQIVPLKFEYLTETPTTLAGYGITNAFTKTESDNRFLSFNIAQSLTTGQRNQAIANLGLSTIPTINLNQGTGILLSPNPNLGVGTVSFNVAWGDNRYHNRLNIISNSSVFSFLGNVEGLQVRAHSGTVSGFPTGLGMTVAFHTPSNNFASTMARTLAIHRTYNTESYYLGSSTASGTTNPWRLIWHNGNLDPVTRTTEQTITGLKYIRRGSTSEQIIMGWDYPDNNGTDYNLRLKSNGAGNNVRYYFDQTVILGVNNVKSTWPVLGFKNWVTLLGSNNYPFGDIETYYNTQTNPATRHPLRVYSDGDAMFKGRIYAGKDNFTNTSFLDSTDTLYSEGTSYAKAGFRTADPRNSAVLDFSTWLLGEYAANASHTKTHDIFIKVNDKVFKLSAEEVV